MVIAAFVCVEKVVEDVAVAVVVVVRRGRR